MSRAISAMGVSFARQVCMGLFALGIVGVLVWAHLPGLARALHMSSVVVISAWFLRRVHGKAQLGVGVYLLVGAVALERLALSPLAWGTRDSSSLIQLWSVATDALVMLFVVAFAYTDNWVLLLCALIVLGGLPATPPGFNWAMFPLALMAFLFRPVLSNGNGRNWVWICVFGWLGLSIVRSPCGFEAARLLSQLALVYVGYWLAVRQTVGNRILTWLGVSLLAPLVVGWGWNMVQARSLSIPHLGWGVNTNVLGIQLGLGSLLLFHVVRWRFSKSAWGIVGLGAVGLFFLESFWALVCLLITAGATALLRGRLRVTAIIVLLMLPVITILVVVIPLPVSWLPRSILVSVLARQFDWKNAILFAGRNPLGLGIGSVHPMALGLTDPSPIIASIPGEMMQYIHHLLLHLMEQVGFPGVIGVGVLMFAWGRQFIRYESTSREAAAGAGLLYLWAHFAADISAMGVPFLVASGALFGLSWSRSAPDVKRGIRVLPNVLPIAVYGYVWIAGMLGFGAWMNLRTGNLEKARSLAMTCSSVWPCDSVALSALEELGLRSPRRDQALCDMRCPTTGPKAVGVAAEFLSVGKSDAAESVLTSICAIDPRGVIPGGGARARVFLAMIAKDRGEEARADSIMAGLFWKEAVREEALGTVDYLALRGKNASAKEAARRYIRQTTDDPELTSLLLARIRSLSSNQAEPVKGSSGDRQMDRLVTDVERLLRLGRVGQAEARLRAASSWLKNDWTNALLRSKVALAKGNIDRAIALASKAVSLSGGAGGPRWTLVKMLSYGEKREEAMRQADLLVRHAPQSSGAWLTKGEMLLHGGKADEAVEALGRALELGADSMSCRILMAKGFRMKGQAAKARAILHEIAKTRPLEAWATLELASWAESEGRLQEALKWARSSLKRAPGHPASRILLGRVLRKLGQYQKARQHLTRVVKDETAAYGWRVDAQKELDIIKGMRVGKTG